MKTNTILSFLLLFIFGCSQQPNVHLKELPQTSLKAVAFSELPEIEQIDFTEVLDNFLYDCQSSRSQKLYVDLCLQAQHTTDAKKFILENFQAYTVFNEDGSDEGLLTGYYEPEIEASLVKSEEYRYPLYETPKDLVIIDLSSVYPEIKGLRLRGRMNKNRVVPYYTRAEIKRSDINSSAICYCKSKIDRFFLEVQGSGKILLDDNSTFYVGYDNQNGHPYSSIGKYLVQSGAISPRNISLQSIRIWLEEHPEKIDEILNKNHAMVFFSKRSRGATGAIGLELIAKSSVAVDSKYIPLGSMLYLSSNLNDKKINKFVFAQDVGGAIKGAVRADYFLGSGTKALKTAGTLKSPLHLWIILPKKRNMNE